MNSSIAHQKACLPIALAYLNNGHSSELHTYYAGVGSSSRPSLVSTRPLRPCSTTWQSLFITNLNNTTFGCALAAGVEARTVANRYCVVVMTLACELSILRLITRQGCLVNRQGYIVWDIESGVVTVLLGSVTLQ
ncbi:unnamed protein product [Sphagnum balticum]